MKELESSQNDVASPVHARDHWMLKAVSVAFIGMALYLLVNDLRSGEIIGLVVCPIVIVIFTFFLLSTGSTEMDYEAITRTSWLGKHRIRWDEVEWIEMAGRYYVHTLVFFSSNKWLPINSPWSWFAYSRQDAKRLESLLSWQIKRRQIEIKKVRYASVLRASKNTRVS